jgi:membrane protein insertase Oxa1/YidC/SpoIIIJ
MWLSIKFSANSFFFMRSFALRPLPKVFIDLHCFTTRPRNNLEFRCRNFLLPRLRTFTVPVVCSRCRLYATEVNNSSQQSQPPSTMGTSTVSPDTASLNAATTTPVSGAELQHSASTDVSVLATSQLATVAAAVAENMPRWQPWTYEYYQHCSWIHFFSLPVEWLIDTLAATGLPMWSAIFVGVLLIRLAMLPLFVIQARNATRLERISKQFRFINARTDLSPQERQLLNMQIIRQNGGLRIFLMPILASIIQLPIYVILFTAVAYMSGYWGLEWLRPQMLTEGIAIWQNLTLPDKTYILPILNTALFIVFSLFLLNPNPTTTPQNNLVRNVFIVLSIIFIPIAARFPVALHIYLLTLTLCSIGQSLLLRNDRVRSLLSVPRLRDPIIKPSIVFDHKPTRASTSPAADTTPSSSSSSSSSHDTHIPPPPPFRSSHSHSRRNK